MKTMLSKYPGTCSKCQEPFPAGTVINWHGRGRAQHQTCPRDEQSAQVAPCWICKDPAGKFRNMGPATPVWCNACFAKELAKTQTVANVRFSRPAAAFVPDAFDMQVEDNMRDACGL